MGRDEAGRGGAEARGAREELGVGGRPRLGAGRMTGPGCWGKNQRIDVLQ